MFKFLCFVSAIFTVTTNLNPYKPEQIVKEARLTKVTQQCEVVRDGVLVYDDVRKTYMCRMGKGNYVAMWATPKVKQEKYYAIFVF